MKRLLAVLLAALLAILLPLQAIAAESYSQSVLTIYSGVSGTGTVLNHNTANIRNGIMFVALDTCTLTEVDTWVSAITGSLSTSSLEIGIFAHDNTNNVPTGAAISNDTTTTATPTAGSWAVNDGLSASLTQGTLYWIVSRNNQGTPASNNFTTRNIGPSLFDPVSGNTAQADMLRKTSSDGGTTWSAALTGTASMRFKCGSNWYGAPLESNATGAVGVGIYSTREVGNVCTVPAGVAVNVAGIIDNGATVTGSPTGTLRARIYSGTTLVLTSAARSNSLVGGAATQTAFRFASSTLVTPGTWRFVIGETTQSDASTARYNLSGLLTIKNDSDSKALIPWTCRQTYFDGSIWTDTDTIVAGMSLILSNNNQGGISAWIPIE